MNHSIFNQHTVDSDKSYSPCSLGTSKVRSGEKILNVEDGGHEARYAAQKSEYQLGPEG